MSKFKKNIYIIILIVLLFTLTGCGDKKNEENKGTKDKVIEEMKYLDTNIIKIMNELNNISMDNYSISSKEITTNIESSQESGGSSSQGGGGSSNSQKSSSSGSSNEKPSESEKITVSQMERDFVIMSDYSDIDWDDIQSTIELINTSWPVIAIDLYSLNVNSNEVNSFTDELDKAIIALKDSNKNDALINLSSMYGYIPVFLKAIHTEDSTGNIYQTKTNILKAYTNATLENWDEVDKNITNAQANFEDILSDFEYSNNNKYKVDKAYILISDLKTSAQFRDTQMFYIKYKNAIQGLNVM